MGISGTVIRALVGESRVITRRVEGTASQRPNALSRVIAVATANDIPIRS